MIGRVILFTESMSFEHGILSIKKTDIENDPKYIMFNGTKYSEYIPDSNPKSIRDQDKWKYIEESFK